VEIYAEADRVDEIEHAIVQIARTGRIGDGKIFRTGLQEAV
jgi:nitrogen regulatory protein PII